MKYHKGTISIPHNVIPKFFVSLHFIFKIILIQKKTSIFADDYNI